MLFHLLTTATTTALYPINSQHADRTIYTFVYVLCCINFLVFELFVVLMGLSFLQSSQFLRFIVCVRYARFVFDLILCLALYKQSGERKKKHIAREYINALRATVMKRFSLSKIYNIIFNMFHYFV